MEMFTDDTLKERYSLAVQRIGQICEESSVPAPFRDYFVRTAAFIQMMDQMRESLESGEADTWTEEQWAQKNHAMYEDILPENYNDSYADPAYAYGALGEEMGRALSFLYEQIRGMIGYIYEGRMQETTVHMELFIQVYDRFQEETLPTYREIRNILYWFVSDYCDVFAAGRVIASIDPAEDFAPQIIMNSDLTDLRYLYRFGEYITENELETARFLNSLPEEEIAQMADTYTEGYRQGFLHAGKPLERKRTVNIRYHIGFERIVRRAIENFAKMGLEPVIYRSALNTVNRKGTAKVGFVGAIANLQYEYDHREDCALYLDAKFVERRLSVIRSTYVEYEELAAQHGGPALIETFGENLAGPVDKFHALHMNEKQQKLFVKMNNELAQITNQYIIGEERSFTIIAFPVPEIGPQFREIFREVQKINTLDNELYGRIQQNLIDALDQGDQVHVKGTGSNKTDLVVALHPLTDSSRQTIFENCVADVNIPVGEVFTSPQLEGTNGVLHVSRVFLNGLSFKDLMITFTDGMITDYSCANFATKEENRAYIEENVLFHNKTLPMGEFAIGTNTTAYVAGKKFGIEAKMPILIAEKTGPHFAVGDTCYSWEEDNPVYNPDGKEIIARDNSVSLLRKTDPDKAYFGCHTDITLPYEELGLLEVTGPNGYRQTLIKDGLFVPEGTQELNKALFSLT